MKKLENSQVGMVIIHKTSRYERERDKFVKNNIQRGEVLIRTLKKFSLNPNHPSLHLEKLGGSNVWTIRVDKGSRIFLIWEDSETVLFIDIGKHDKYRKY